jgi:hypothetical protein
MIRSVGGTPNYGTRQIRIDVSKTGWVITKPYPSLEYGVEGSSTNVKWYIVKYCPRQTPTNVWGQSTLVIRTSAAESVQ